MFYAMTFYGGREEWCDMACRGHEAPTPEAAVRAAWSHVYTNDIINEDWRRIREWIENGPDDPTWHVIAQDGTQWLTSFEVVPVGFTDTPSRRVVWELRHVKTEPASPELVAAYPARWTWISEDQAAIDVAEGLDWIETGWWIDHFCTSGACDECLRLGTPFSAR